MNDQVATPRAFLHISLPKTGTTYLQSTLWGHTEVWREHGLLLPGNHRRHLLASLDVREVPGLANRPGNTEHPWQDLLDECRGWRGDILITHEFFASASPAQVQRMTHDLAGYDVHVVVTARSVANLFPSRWQEWVKNGGRRPIDAYPPREDYRPQDNWGWGSFDLADVLSRWSEVVDPSRIHVIAVDPADDPGLLWERFASVVGVGGAEIEQIDESVNTTLGVVEVELLRRINRHLTDFRSPGDRGRWIRGHLGEGDWMPRNRAPFKVGPEKRAELEARSDRAVAMLSDGGFDLIGSLEALQPRDHSSRRHPDHVRDGEMLDSSTRLVAAMLSEIRRLTEENDELRRAVSGPGDTEQESAGSLLDRLRRK
ncbi:hypothetical protein ncot_18270 [Nocardioides sp. JQ2195]|uniref:hypothetical protein n=1 Tax=Nocardioides sp. JQ2195 TaxID=2592334 RepID=UPI00143EB6C9|nr:hypothetical protein [Nocardioides sp. JQ2195]QIX28317.1 hypothetical protein ncot_18270 [Nocardioides sp. JQ2195]